MTENQLNPLHVVACVITMNRTREGWPQKHRLYYRSGRSLVHLTAEGEDFYRVHKGQIDRIAREVYEPELAEWSKVSVERLLVD